MAQKTGIDKSENPAVPNMERLMNDDKYWNLLDVMGKAAKNHGKAA